MAITKVVLKERKGTQTLTGGKRVRVYQSIYHAKSNVLNEDPYTVWSHPDIPTLSPISTWPTDSAAVLVKVDPQQDRNTPDLWVVTCDYTSNPDIKDTNPTIIERSPVQRQRILIRDVNGNVILNSAGELFNPPHEREDHSPAFTISKKLLFWPYALELAYTDAINSVAVVYLSKGIAYGAGLIKCNGFTGRETYEDGLDWWQVSVALEVNWEGWNKPLIDCGYREKKVVSGTPKLMPIIGVNGEAVTEPVMLNGSGVADPFRSSPYELSYKKHREVPFADLFALFGII